LIAEYNSWEKKEDLENTKEVVVEFKERVNAKVRQQEKLDIAEKRNFRRREILSSLLSSLVLTQYKILILDPL